MENNQNPYESPTSEGEKRPKPERRTGTWAWVIGGMLVAWFVVHTVVSMGGCR